MSRQLTPQSTLDNLKKEAKRWHRALRAQDAAARARLERILPNAPAEPALRDVQLALAREHSLAGWADLKREVERIELERTATPRERAVNALLAAAERGDANAVGELLDRHPDIINERSELDGHSGGRTALHFGVHHQDVVRVLLERGADPNIRDEGDDAMPLHFAAERGDLDIVRMLIEHGADPVGEGTGHELNVLGWAICWSYVHNVAVAEYLLAHGAQHTIHTAVALGAVDVIREIVGRSPADLEKVMDQTNLRRLPLHLAVVKKRADSLATLLELGANPEAVDAAGLTALDHAATNSDEELVRLLLEYGARVNLPAAIALNRSDDVERLLREEPEALKPGNRYGTLIVRASGHASGEVIERMIRAGASVDARDNTDTSVDQTEGYTALHEAAWNGNIDAIKVLLKRHANPNVREKKYCGTPAGWAAYAGHEEACRLILEARIDPFQAVDFDLVQRIPAIVQQGPWSLNRPFREYAPWEPDVESRPAPWHTPLVWAVVSNKLDAARVLLEQGAALIAAPDGRTLVQLARDAGHDEMATLLTEYQRFDETHAGRVRLFVKHACPDHDIRGLWHHEMARHTALRLLQNHPEIARDSFYTAIVTGDVAEVERALNAQPELATLKGGPKAWQPLLYLTFTRLPLQTVTDHAVAIARLLLDRGADPNVYFMAGDSRYTPLVGAIGEGEEDRPAHQQRDALVRLLLDRGAEPYDIQVIYNIHFHGKVLWFLKLMHEYALKLGREADWADPNWSMLNMGGYGSGARWHLDIAVKDNDLELADWALSHGAAPNAEPARDGRFPRHTLYEEAIRRGSTEMAELLLRHGATRTDVQPNRESEFVAAALRLDRSEAKRLLEQHPGYRQSTKALFAAAKQNRADVVELLLDLGFSADLEDNTKQRTLHMAAYDDAVDVGRVLIERGAEIDPVEQNWNNTPLSAAVYTHAQRMIELLGPYSSDVWHVMFIGAVDRMRELLEQQPERVTSTSSERSTLLMWLPDDETRALELIELLLAHGVDPTVRDEMGRTAADYAVRRGLERAAARLRSAVPSADRTAGQET